MAIRKAWFQRPHRWLLTILCVGAISIEFWEVLAPERFKLGLRENAPLVILALLSLYILAYLEQDGPKRNLLAELGIENIFRSRKEQGQIGSYQNLLASAKVTLFIVGITVRDISHDEDGYLRAKAAEGCRIDLLMLHPKFSKNINPILDPVAHAENHDLTHAFAEAMVRVRALAEDVSKTTGTLTVKFYDTAPTLSLTVKDGDTHDGQMHVEIVPHQVRRRATFRPILDLRKYGEREIFSEIYQRYRALWDASCLYIQADSKGIKLNSSLDQEISRDLNIRTYPLGTEGGDTMVS